MPRRKTKKIEKPLQGVRRPAYILVFIIVAVGLFLYFRRPTVAVQFNMENPLILSIVGGLVVSVTGLFVEYTFFQRKPISLTPVEKRKSKGSSTTKSKASLQPQGVQKSFQSLFRNRVSAYTWENAIRIAVVTFKDNLDKYKWENEQTNVVNFSIQKDRATFDIIVTTQEYAKPIPIEKYSLIISKTGDIIEMKPVTL